MTRSLIFSKQNPESKRKNVIFDSSIHSSLFSLCYNFERWQRLRSSTPCQAFLICDSFLNFFFLFFFSTFFFFYEINALKTTRCEIVEKEKTRINFFFRISHRCRSLDRFYVFVNFSFFFILFRFFLFYIFFFFIFFSTILKRLERCAVRYWWAYSSYRYNIKRERDCLVWITKNVRDTR